MGSAGLVHMNAQNFASRHEAVVGKYKNKLLSRRDAAPLVPSFTVYRTLQLCHFGIRAEIRVTLDSQRMAAQAFHTVAAAYGLHFDQRTRQSVDIHPFGDLR